MEKVKVIENSVSIMMVISVVRYDKLEILENLTRFNAEEVLGKVIDLTYEDFIHQQPGAVK